MLGAAAPSKLVHALHTFFSLSISEPDPEQDLARCLKQAALLQPELFLVEPPLENVNDVERQIRLLKQRNDVVKLNAEQPAEMYSLAKVRWPPVCRLSCPSSWPA